MTRPQIPDALLPFLDVVAEMLADRIAERLAEVLPKPFMTVVPVSKAEYMTTKTAAKELGVGVSTLEMWRTKGKGPTWIKVGGSAVRYSRVDLDAWITKQKRGGR